MVKRAFFIIVVFLYTVSAVFADIGDIIIQPYFENLDDGTYTVELEFKSTDNVGAAQPLIVTESASLISTSTQFNNGFSEIFLYNINKDRFSSPNVFVDIEIVGEGLSQRMKFFSSAYALRAHRSENVLYPKAETLGRDTIFTNTITVNAEIDFGDFLVVPDRLPYFRGEGRFSSFYAMDLEGVSVNVTDLFRDGVDFKDSLSWIPSTNRGGGNGIVYTRSDINSVGINYLSPPRFTLDVSGAISSNVLLMDNSRLTALQDWVEAGDVLSYTGAGGVGIYDSFSDNKLKVNGGIRLRPSAPNSIRSGTIYYEKGSSQDNFFGIVTRNSTIVHSPLNGIQASGAKGQLSFFEEALELGGSSDITLGLFSDFSLSSSLSFFSDSMMEFLFSEGEDIYQVIDISSKNGDVIVSINSKGDVSIGNLTLLSEDDHFSVKGELNATRYFLDGAPIELRVSLGELFLMNYDSLTKTAGSIYFDDGYVSIGQFNPSSNLEISSPYRELDSSIPTKDPAITFRSRGSPDTVYTLGIDSDDENQFRIEQSEHLGSVAPLFIIKKNHLSIGNDDARANLHIFGEKGLLLEGDFSFFDDTFVTENVSVFQQPGNRLFFNTYNGSVRKGRAELDEWSLDNVGIYSVGLGELNVSPGNFSSVLAGRKNNLEGAYSTLYNGNSNRVDGYFSGAFGRGASVPYDGSFVFSFARDLRYSFDEDSFTPFASTVPRQFLIGSAQGDVLSMGVNTSDYDSILAIQAIPITFTLFEQEMNITSSDAIVVFDDLVSNNIISIRPSQFGFLRVPFEQKFKEYYSITYSEDMNSINSFIVSFNASEVFEDLISLAKHNSVSSIPMDLIEYVVPSDNWKRQYTYDTAKSYVTGSGVSVPGFSSFVVHKQFLMYQKNVLKRHGKNVMNLVNTDLANLLDSQNNYADESVDGSLVKECTTRGGFSTFFSPANAPVNVSSFTSSLVIDADAHGGFTLNDLNSMIVADINKVQSYINSNPALSDPIKNCELLASKNFVGGNISITYNRVLKVLKNHFPDDQYYGGGVYNNYLNTDLFPQIFQIVSANLNNISGFDLNAFDKDKFYTVSDFQRNYTLPLSIRSLGVSMESIISVITANINQNIFLATSYEDKPVFSVNNNLSMGVGFDHSSLRDADLNVSGNMGVFESSRGSSQVQADLLILNPSTSLSSLSEGESGLFIPYSIFIGDNDETIDLSPGVKVPLEGRNPSLVFDVTGNAYIGVESEFNPVEDSDSDISQDFKLTVFGALVGGGFVDSSTGEELSAEAATTSFKINSSIPSSIYFVSGNVGIGSNNPETLLYLSSEFPKEVGGQSSPTNDPKITFDLDGFDYFFMGMKKGDSSSFKLATPENFASNPEFSVSSFGVGIGGVSEGADLFVSGNVALDSLMVATDNGIELFMTPYLATKQFFVYSATSNSYIKVSESGLPWSYQGNNPYLNDGTKVHIGTDPMISSYNSYILGYPDLVVSGNLTSDVINISSQLIVDELILEGTEKNQMLKFASGRQELPLFVRNDVLILDLGNGNEASISKVLARGAARSGSFTGWKENTTFISQKADMLFKLHDDMLFNPIDPPELWEYQDPNWVINQDVSVTLSSTVSINGKLALDYEFIHSNSKVETSFLLFEDSSVAFKGDASIDYLDSGTYYDDSFSYSYVTLNMRVVTSNGTLKGIDVSLDNIDENGAQKSLVNGATLVGTYVSLSDLNVQDAGPDTTGFKYPAIFMGDVSIGGESNRNLDYFTLNPEAYLLNVDGGVKASSFFISERLMVSSLNVTIGFRVYDQKVGIGGPNDVTSLSQFDSDLIVFGDIHSFDSNLGYIESGSFFQKDNKFIVDQSGFVGFGTLEDKDNVDVVFYKNFDRYGSTEFEFKHYNLLVEKEGADLDLEENLSLQQIFIQTEGDFNYFGAYPGSSEENTVKGVDLDMTGLSASSTDAPDVYGLFSRASSVNRLVYSGFMPTPNAAVFLNGIVGVGTTSPDLGFDLVIEGSLRAKNSDFLNVTSIPEAGVFDHLTVRDGASIIGVATMNNLYVFNLKYEELGADYFKSPLLSLDLSRNVTINRIVTVNADVFIRDQLVVNSELKVVSGNADVLLGGEYEDSRVDRVVALSSPFVSKTFIVEKNIQSVSLNVNELEVHSNGSVFLNNRNQDLFVDHAFFVDPVSDSFDAADNYTWNAARLFSGLNSVGSYIGVSFLTGESFPPLAILAKQTVVVPADRKNSAADIVFVGLTQNVTLSSIGNLGILDKTPLERLSVVGDGRFSSDVTVPTVNVSDLFFISSSRVSPTVSLIVTANFGKRVTSNFPITFPTVNNAIVMPSGVSLYYLQNTAVAPEGFYFFKHIDGKSVSSNLISSFQKNDYTFSYYDEDSYLKSFPLSTTSNVDQTIATISFKTETSVSSSIVLESFVSRNIGSTVFNRIHLAVEKRSQVSSGLIGLDIDISATKNEAIKNQNFVGIGVDMRDLVSTYNEFIDSSTFEYSSNKYAALFNGGEFLITSSDMSSASSDSIVFVDNQIAYDLLIPSVIVSSNSGHAFVVSTKSIGVNSDESVPKAALYIVDDSEVEPLVLDGAGQNKLLIFNNGLGIGTDLLNVSLNIQGNLKATTLNVNEFSITDSSSFNFSNDSVFRIDELTNFVGVHVSNPLALLHIGDTLDEDASSVSRVRKELDMFIVNRTSDVTYDFLGMDIVISSNTSFDYFDGPLLKGVDVDLSTLRLADNAIAVGVSINADIANAKSIIFITGNVGINTDTPEYRLDVNGTIQAVDLDLDVEPDFDNFQSVTVNSLTVIDDARMKDLTLTGRGFVTVNSLLTFRESPVTFDFKEAILNSSSVTLNSLKADMFSIKEGATLNIGGSWNPAVNLDNSFVVSQNSIEGVFVKNFDHNNQGGDFDFNVKDISLNDSTDLGLTHISFLKSLDVSSEVSTWSVGEMDTMYFTSPNESITSLVGRNSLYIDDTDYLLFKSVDFSSGVSSNVKGGIPFVVAKKFQSTPLFTVSEVSDFEFLNVSGNFIMDSIVTQGYTIEEDYVLQSIKLDFLNRESTSHSNEFSGLRIKVTSNENVEDNVIGLIVDMSELETAFYQQAIDYDNSQEVSSNKYAATFVGGEFAILSSGNYEHSDYLGRNAGAEVYVSSNHKGYMGDFLVGDLDNPSLLITSSPNFRIGIGTDNTTVGLVAIASDNSSLMKVYSKTDELILGVFDPEGGGFSKSVNGGG
ncbi:hypothetical protein DID78_02805 [Candidatus Marinamargulisbacteria bacterium SCGC AG-343-D04]|nr:hypothetical protein DID78_02805 [Candidatus Marinamargulisbacteria bacterium SCGC AG-343-D04]